MFIVCPSCSGPYRIPAEQIAPLVQTACPHCDYRIILDFEAANDPSLREAGHQFAQGFESVEAYASVYDHVTSKPDAQPRASTGVAAQSAAARAPAHTPAATPVSTPAAARPMPTGIYASARIDLAEYACDGEHTPIVECDLYAYETATEARGEL